jgi:hypothetical protein
MEYAYMAEAIIAQQAAEKAKAMKAAEEEAKAAESQVQQIDTATTQAAEMTEV